MQITQTIGQAHEEALERFPRVALLTPYTGGNLGDAAIQDAMIANLRRRIPGARFLGITLNCENFLNQHGDEAFPLLAPSMPFSYQSRTRSASEPDGTRPADESRAHRVRRALRSGLGSVPFLKRARAWLASARGELSHAVDGYRVLRKQDLLIVSGGGQLDERWGGPWQFPFAVCKWALLARAARIPCAVASVGACQVTSRAARTFFSIALRLCSYRSYRDTKTRAIAASFLPRTTDDLIVPDVAFSLPDSELPSPASDIRKMARGQTVVALNPIAYAKPGHWPISDRVLYDRYVQQMAQVLCCLSRQGHFLVIACSSRGGDEGVIADILGQMDEETKQSLNGRIHFPTIKNWRDFVAVLRNSDYLIASRLHGTILGFLAQTPAVAISFDPKVDWLMEDLHQTDYLLHIRDFTAKEVLSAIDRLKDRRDIVVEQITSYRQGTLAMSSRQYDSLTKLVLTHNQSNS